MSLQAEPVYSVEIPGLKKLISGKVRDVYDLGDRLLLVASDRISAFDVIMADAVPDKGRALTQLARFWFRTLRPFTVTHYITCDDDYIAAAIDRAGGKLSNQLRSMIAGRSTLGVKAEPFAYECVVRGYIAGSLWKEYCAAGGKTKPVTLHGYEFPKGLRESDKLPAPLFTPATKATSGHDENVSPARVAVDLGPAVARSLARASIALYTQAAALAASRGILIADTKFEFGMHSGVVTLIDEALTPDSSRFWDASTWEPGRSQDSFDKQYLRDWLDKSDWNKTFPPPPLPGDVVAATRAKYLEAYQRIVGAPLDPVREV